jgi:Flp pilus assembly protein CpaB
VAISAQRRRRALVAIVAALIAAGAFYLAMEYAGKTSTTTPATSTTTTAPPVQTVTVVVASSAIPQGDLLTTSNLKTAPVDGDVLTTLTHAGGTDYASVAALTLSKHYAATTVLAGLPILSSMVTTTAPAPTPNSGGSIPDQLPAGYVATSLPYSPASASGTGEGTGGYIQASDRIDILVNDDGSVTWAYQNVLVLAVGAGNGTPVAPASSSPSGSASASSLIMVELPRQDAAALAEVEDISGAVIQYLVVSSNDYPSPSAAPVPSATAPPQPVSGSNPNSFFGG